MAPGGMALRFAAGARKDAYGVPGGAAPSSMPASVQVAPLESTSSSSSSSNLAKSDETTR